MGRIPRKVNHEFSRYVCANYLQSRKLKSDDVLPSTTIDGAPQSTSTNLVLKGIIAIRAMAVISNLRKPVRRFQSVFSQFPARLLERNSTLTL